MSDFDEYLRGLKMPRIWWKPLTWFFRKPALDYWPMGNELRDNPYIPEPGTYVTHAGVETTITDEELAQWKFHWCEQEENESEDNHG